MWYLISVLTLASLLVILPGCTRGGTGQEVGGESSSLTQSARYSYVFFPEMRPVMNDVSLVTASGRWSCSVSVSEDAVVDCGRRGPNSLTSTEPQKALKNFQARSASDGQSNKRALLIYPSVDSSQCETVYLFARSGSGKVSGYTCSFVSVVESGGTGNRLCLPTQGTLEEAMASAKCGAASAAR